jgi:hypothetical protein
VYFCVTAMVGSLPAGTERPLRVDVDVDDASLTIVILDGDEPSGDGESARPATPELPEVLSDRVEALEGTLRATSGREWSRYELTVPLTASEESAATKDGAVRA